MQPCERVVPKNLAGRKVFSCLAGERDGVLGFGFLESVLVHYCISLFYGEISPSLLWR